ncbi:MAG TPA: hypothetical protein VLM85_09600 [Polyangiaceae bacterium]|nr:hypothetical protein [Polyangiaceae bacterium]
MSEYQCYEFVALDRPLTSKQMAALRAISTRAEITPTRFWNEYQWGDLKADPATLVERYFDAHMYFANWGTHRLMLRVPAKRIDPKALRAYFAGDAARAKVAGEHVILDLHSEDEQPESYEASQGSLGALVPLRAELMRGDLRVAYLAWLLAVQAADVPETAEEPPIPAGLSDLTAAQAAMVEFLRIDEDLILAAAEGNAREADDRTALREWVLALPPRAKDVWLKRAVGDPDLALGGELLRAFRADAKPTRLVRRRTVAELLANVEAHRERRERAEVKRAAKANRAADAARSKRLDGLAKRVDAAWKELEALVERSAYDDAIKLAIDLRDLAKRDGSAAPFATAFEELRKRQLPRRGFFDRWKRENGPRRW